MSPLRSPPPEILEPLWPWLEALAPAEGCAVLLQGPTGWRLRLMTNARTGVAARSGFAFRDDEWLACLREADHRRERVAWIIHSHPDGGLELSAEDLAGARATPGAAWLLVRLRGGRVDACALHLLPAEFKGSGDLERG